MKLAFLLIFLSVLQPTRNQIQPLDQYRSMIACEYTFNVSCGNQSVSLDYLSNDTTSANGNAASQNSWPWVVSIWNDDATIFYCSGVILSDKYVLASAQCVAPYTNQAPSLTIIVGLKTLPNSFSNFNSTFMYKVASVYGHPKFNASANAVDYNLALIKTSSSILFDAVSVMPICLPKSASSFTNILNQTVFSVSW